MSQKVIAKIKRVNSENGRYFFSTKAMRFFNSRILGKTIENYNNKPEPDGAWFVTSEKNDYDSPRLYTMRYCDYNTGEVSSIGGFQSHETPKQAWDYLQKNDYPTE